MIILGDIFVYLKHDFCIFKHKQECFHYLWRKRNQKYFFLVPEGAQITVLRAPGALNTENTVHAKWNIFSNTPDLHKEVEILILTFRSRKDKLGDVQIVGKWIIIVHASKDFYTQSYFLQPNIFIPNYFFNLGKKMSLRMLLLFLCRKKNLCRIFHVVEYFWPSRFRFFSVGNIRNRFS